MLKFRFLVCSLATTVTVALVLMLGVLGQWSLDQTALTVSAVAGCAAVVAGIISAASFAKNSTVEEYAKWLGFGFVLAAISVLAGLSLAREAYIALALWYALSGVVMSVSSLFDYAADARGGTFNPTILFLCVVGITLGLADLHAGNLVVGLGFVLATASIGGLLAVVLDYLNQSDRIEIPA